MPLNGYLRKSLTYLYIFQELIQNAEDAGATQVKFLIDHHNFGNNPQKLQHPGLAKFQVRLI